MDLFYPQIAVLIRVKIKIRNFFFLKKSVISLGNGIYKEIMWWCLELKFALSLLFGWSFCPFKFISEKCKKISKRERGVVNSLQSWQMLSIGKRVKYFERNEN